jgi:hypothetical protein
MIPPNKAATRMLTQIRADMEVPFPEMETSCGRITIFANGATRVAGSKTIRTASFGLTGGSAEPAKVRIQTPQLNGMAFRDSGSVWQVWGSDIRVVVQFEGSLLLRRSFSRIAAEQRATSTPK